MGTAMPRWRTSRTTSSPSRLGRPRSSSIRSNMEVPGSVPVAPGAPGVITACTAASPSRTQSMAKPSWRKPLRTLSPIMSSSSTSSTRMTRKMMSRGRLIVRPPSGLPDEGPTAPLVYPFIRKRRTVYARPAGRLPCRNNAVCIPRKPNHHGLFCAYRTQVAGRTSPPSRSGRGRENPESAAIDSLNSSYLN